MVPWEIWHGQRLNVNRLLGNGRDDNGNGVVDEPAEAETTTDWPSGRWRGGLARYDPRSARRI